MPGKIRDEDIALVRERSPIDEVVGEYLQLRNAGGGSLKGLCPFHDEKTPSFNVTPARGLWYCFSEAEGGDVIKFIEKIDNLSFPEAIERLAARAGIELRYEQGGTVPGHEQSQRRRLLAANQAAAEFFSERLRSQAAAGARGFLSERGFELADADRFGLGYAPAEWETLTRHLRGRGYSDAELLTAGLASQGRRGPVDRFRGRLIWPIRDLSGDVIAFGARKLNPAEDGPKYLNTPETPLFKKSSVLYGADLAKRDIAHRRQAVIVEGYTDVMACHLAGVTTAVATSGTSFGDGHIKILRRLLMDASEFRGEVIFTFDGDEAGQRAALRAFGLEEKFVTQTFVAIQPDGLDPCDLRQAQGDAAVRDLVARRVPVFEFAIRSELAKYNLDTNEGQLGALDAAARIVARIKDRGLRDRYAVSLDRWLGLMDEQFVLERIRAAGHGRGNGTAPARGGAGGSSSARGIPSRGGVGGSSPRDNTARGADSPAVLRPGNGLGQRAGVAATPAPGHARSESPDPREAAAAEAERYDLASPVIQVEREALKLAVQRPALCGPEFDALGEGVFTAARHEAVSALIAACGGTAAAGSAREWAARLRDQAPDDAARGFVTQLAVEPMRVPNADGEPDARYASAVLARVEELAVSRRIAAAKARLQRMSPVEEQGFNRLFGDLIALEQQRKVLVERAAGAL
ncbi:MAG TPA: DNA primase [Streptosporangiaceae bacterium]|nr:DNA primase [Streptosporangiaceae bacterium]